MLGPSNDNNRGEKPDGERQNDPAKGDAFENIELPDLGPKIAEGTYVISAESEDGETCILSAGVANLHEQGAIGTETLDKTTLDILQVKTVEDARRALCGDLGTPTTSVSVGYNKSYAEGWSRLWGPPSAN